MLAIICVSTLLCIVLGVKKVVWSRGKAWGVYGRQFLLRFSNLSSNPNFMECMQFKDNLIKIKQRVINALSSKDKKKDNKKASSNILVQTSITNK